MQRVFKYYHSMLYMKHLWITYLGVMVLVFLGISYFIKFGVDSGNNYIIYDSFLGILIFHNPFILLGYLLIAFVLIFLGLKNRR